MRRKLLAIRMIVIYHSFKFFSAICNVLAKKHHELYIKWEHCYCEENMESERK